MNRFSRSFLTLVLSSAGVVITLQARPAFGQALPDDVDYEKYYQLFLSSQQNSKARRAEATRAAEEARSLDAQVAQADSVVRGHRDRIGANASAIAGLQSEIPMLRGEAARLQNEALNHRLQIEANGNRIRELGTMAMQIQQAMGMENQRFDSLRRNFDDAHRRLEEADKSLATGRESAKAKRDRLAEVQKQIPVGENKKNELQAAALALSNEIGQQTAEAKQAGEQVAQFEKRLDAEQQDVENVRAKVVAQRDVVKANKKLVDSLKADPASPAEAVAKAEAQLAAEQAQLDKLEQRLETARSQVQTVREKLQDAKARLNGAENRVATATKALAELQKQVKQAEAELVALRAESVALPRDIEDLKDQNEKLAKKREELSRQRERAGEEVARSRAILDRMNADLAGVSNERRLLDDNSRQHAQLFDSKSRAAQANEDRARWDENEIARLAQENSALQAQLSQAESQLPGLRKRQRLAQESARVTEAEAVRAEAVTSAALAKYQEVRKFFEARLKSARQRGSSQGVEQGDSDGTAQGQADGSRVGSQEGDAAGTEQGRAAGLQRGRADGSARGKVDGYNQGRSAPANYEQGLAAGTIRGRADADAEAQAKDYPAARRERREERFSVIPSRTVEIDNAKPASAPSLSSSGSASFLGGLLSKVSSTTTFGEFSSPSTVASVEAREIGPTLAFVKVDPSRADCNLDATVFIEACRAAFEESYGKRFDESYRPAYDDSRADAFERARVSAYEAHKNDRYKEGYDGAYALAFADGERSGAADAHADGFAKGKAAGFAARIADARAEARTRGTVDEDALFASSPMVRMLDAKATAVNGGTADGLVAGDDARLQLTLANFGARDAKGGQVKIQVSAVSSNVSVEEGSLSIAAIPANAKAIVSNAAKIRVSRLAGAGTVKLKVKATFPDGGTQEREVTFRTGLHIFAHTETKLNLKPWINQGLFAPKKHVIEVMVQNPSDNDAIEDFRVTLELPSKKGIEIVTGTVNVGKLDAGEKKTIELHYRLTDKDLARGNTIPMKIRVNYGKRLSSEEEFTLTPVIGL